MNDVSMSEDQGSAALSKGIARFLLRILHRMAAVPWIYDIIQAAVGVRRLQAILSAKIARYGAGGLVIEAGGGTGFQRPLWGAAYTYVCLDIDLVKLVGFRKKFPQGLAVLGDATQLPFPSESADATVCVFLIHHLGDDMLPELMAELQRVLKPGGLLLLAEPDKAMDRPLTRLLWRLDRGSHPRSLDEIQAILRKHFQVVEAERTKMLHPFLIFVCETLDGNPVPQPG